MNDGNLDLAYLIIHFGVYLKVLIVVLLILLMVVILTLAERRISGWIQNRHGPNRVGWGGILQPIADALKFLLKEDIIPGHVDRFLYLLAPALALLPALITFAVIPFGDQMTVPIGGELITFRFQIADLNVGVLYVLAVSSLAVYSLIVGGFGSNNKYSMLGGLRSSAQMISYELPMGLAIVSVVMMSGSLRLNDIVYDQTALWNVFRQPLGCIVFIVAAFAETNRLPFDLPEAEQELVGGYHTEYSSMKFSSFMLAEYAHIITASAMMTTLFFGGWHVPFLQSLNLSVVPEQIIQIVAFVVKSVLFMLFFIWVRWTLPRFRYDQLMNLGWKSMVPLALLNVIVTGAVMTFF